jgi:hypothetical protein
MPKQKKPSKPKKRFSSRAKKAIVAGTMVPVLAVGAIKAIPVARKHLAERKARKAARVKEEQQLKRLLTGLKWREYSAVKEIYPSMKDHQINVIMNLAKEDVLMKDSPFAVLRVLEVLENNPVSGKPLEAKRNSILRKIRALEAKYEASFIRQKKDLENIVRELNGLYETHAVLFGVSWQNRFDNTVAGIKKIMNQTPGSRQKIRRLWELAEKKPGEKKRRKK